MSGGFGKGGLPPLPGVAPRPRPRCASSAWRIA